MLIWLTGGRSLLVGRRHLAVGISMVSVVPYHMIAVLYFRISSLYFSLSIQLFGGCLLMFEVPDPGEHHGHIMVVAESDGVLVFHRSARLDHSPDAPTVGNFYAVWKGKERV